MKITSWKKFAAKIRIRGCVLLNELDKFPNSILVTGCQRSGTTILARIITQSEGMVNYRFGKDDELDAALILAGVVSHEPRGRYCFQTTYLNNCYQEYEAHKDNGNKIIFVIRNPYSVVYSMVYNWKRFALNELFVQCGMDYADSQTQALMKLFGVFFLPTVTKACYAYVGKTLQAIELARIFNNEEIIFVDYDSLINSKHNILPRLYEFLELPYDTTYEQKLSSRSIDKFQRLSSSKKNKINSICFPVYEQVKNLVPPSMQG